VQLARALATFAPGLVGYGLVAHLTRVHVARGDARTPAIATGVGWLVVVAADVGLVVAMPRDWTAAALGIGTTIGMSVAAIGLVVTLVRSAGSETLAGLGRTAAAAAGSGIIAAGLAVLVAGALPPAGAVVSTATSVLVGGLCLLLFVGLTRVLDPDALRLLRRGLGAGRRG